MTGGIPDWTRAYQHTKLVYRLVLLESNTLHQKACSFGLGHPHQLHSSPSPALRLCKVTCAAPILTSICLYRHTHSHSKAKSGSQGFRTLPRRPRTGRTLEIPLPRASRQKLHQMDQMHPQNLSRTAMAKVTTSLISNWSVMPAPLNRGSTTPAGGYMLWLQGGFAPSRTTSYLPC